MPTRRSNCVSDLRGPGARVRVAGGFRLVLLAVLWAARAGAQDGPEQVLEYRVKAAMLYNIARFVEWPEDAWERPQDPLVVCIVGRDPFGEILDSTFSGKRIHGRPVILTRHSRGTTPGVCHLAFLGASEKSRADAVISALGSAPTLTVSELPRFAERGGMIAFVSDSGRIRLAVDPAAAERAGLHISSQLLELAILSKPRISTGVCKSPPCPSSGN